MLLLWVLLGVCVGLIILGQFNPELAEALTVAFLLGFALFVAIMVIAAA